MKSLEPLSGLGARILSIVVFLFPLLAGLASPVAAAPRETNRAVYTLTNAVGGNAVLAYNHSADGFLSFRESYPTGGLGSGAGLGSQGAVILSEDSRWLFAVDAGSNQISTFAVRAKGLVLVDVVDSGGIGPISVANHKDLLYVLNAGGSGNISGFSIKRNGSLSPLPGSTQPLSNGGVGAAPGPAQISFGSDGNTLVVTEKGTDLIDTYEVEDGIAGAPVMHPSAGATPFGFAFDRHNHLIVSEAFGAAPGASALSSYGVEEDTFELISPSIGTTQTAACWVVISKNGKYAYTTNAGSGSISSYRIHRKKGSLTLLEAIAASTGSGSTPLDMALSNNGKYLYVLGAGSNTISAFQVRSDGRLRALGSAAVPPGVVGMAAY